MLCVIPVKTGIQRRVSTRHVTHMRRRRGALNSRFRGNDAY